MDEYPVLCTKCGSVLIKGVPHCPSCTVELIDCLYCGKQHIRGMECPYRTINKLTH